MSKINGQYLSYVLMNIKVKQVLVDNLGSHNIRETAKILANFHNWKCIILEYKKKSPNKWYNHK